MTTIRIAPDELIYAGKLFQATADEYRVLSGGFAATGTAGIAPSIAGQVAAELGTLVSDLNRIATELENEAHALILIAEFIREAEAQGWERGVSEEMLTDLFTAVSALGRYADDTGLSRAAAVSRLMTSATATDEFLANLPEGARAAGWLGFVFNVYLVTRETGDFQQAIVRSLASVAGGAAGTAAASYTCGVVFGWTGIGLLGCIGAGMVGGGWLADKAAQQMFVPRYLGSDEWRLAKANTPSGLLPIEEKIRDMEADAGLEEARASLTQEYIAAGLSPEEARERAERDLPDYSDAQLSP